MGIPQINDIPPEQRRIVRRVIASLERQYAGTFGPETIERFVVDSLNKLIPGARVTTFLPVLTPA